MTKKELLYNLDTEYDFVDRPIYSLIKKLIEETDENDLDFKEVLNDGMGENIVGLLLSYYTDIQLLIWLRDVDFDIFNEYRFAKKVYRDDYESEEDFIENSGAFYEGILSCLMYNEETGCYVIWIEDFFRNIKTEY